MNRIIALLCALFVCMCSISAMAEKGVSAGTSGRWTYLKGTEDGDLITCTENFLVYQNGPNSRELEGNIWYYMDVPYIWLLISNGNRYATYNYGPYDKLYYVSISDSYGRTSDFVGVVPVDDGMMLLMDDMAAYDRVYYWTDLARSDMDGIVSLLNSGHKLSGSVFPYSEYDQASYRFDFYTTGFADAWELLGGAAGMSVKVTAQQVSLRRADGSFIRTLPVGAEILVTGYDRNADMILAEYDDASGYVKGAGLNVSRDELLRTFRKIIHTAEQLRRGKASKLLGYCIHLPSSGLSAGTRMQGRTP